LTDRAFAPRGLPPFAYLFISMTGGISGGFVTVTLGHTLSAMGVPVAQIATLISLAVLPSTLRFLIGPVIDLTLTPLKWVAICAVSIFVSMSVIALTPLSIKAMPTVDLLALILGFAGNAKVCAVAAAMAATSRNDQRGAIAGWTNAGGLGGAGLGGGAGLWLAVHAGGVPVAGLLLAAAGVILVLPVFWLRVPPIDHGSGVAAKVAEILVVLWRFLRTRKGMLVVIVLLIPCSEGAAIHLLPAVAKDWGVSADMVALFTGLLGAVGTMPGCVIGGYLCDRFPRRVFYAWAGLAFAASEAAMALAPHTPPWFGVMVLLNAFTLGLGFAGIAAVIYDCLGERAVATVITVLSSLCNIPLVTMTVVVGRVQTAHGSNAMLATEAAAAVISLAGYGALAWLWKPAPLGEAIPAKAFSVE
jgi:PAT family beta-lactamase induction signal transducer AmpG